MDEPRRRLAPLLAVPAALAGAVGLLVWLTEPGAGPAPVAWDREACGHCRMHVGDRHFAAQLVPAAGEPVNFDDPGCLFLYLDERASEPATLYFRHLTEDRWLARGEVGFLVGVERTPMGFGVAATAAGPGTLPLGEARAWLRAQRGAQ